jgi:hypothetical protein
LPETRSNALRHFAKTKPDHPFTTRRPRAVFFRLKFTEKC